jgi:zinc transport system permease protein
MLDDFFVRALVGGIGVALVAGPLGCFIVWRRMAYFGDTMAHSALLGVALALLLDLNLTLGVFAITAFVAFALVLLQRQAALPSDAILGILSHSTLALGLVLVAFMAWLRIDLLSYLFGDLLAVTRFDIALIYAGGLVTLVILALIWRPLLAGTVSQELAAAEALRPRSSPSP